MAHGCARVAEAKLQLLGAGLHVLHADCVLAHRQLPQRVFAPALDRRPQQRQHLVGCSLALLRQRGTLLSMLPSMLLHLPRHRHRAGAGPDARLRELEFLERLM
eukprot:4308012-Prymnesium_polylepis.1